MGASNGGETVAEPNIPASLPWIPAFAGMTTGQGWEKQRQVKKSGKAEKPCYFRS